MPLLYQSLSAIEIDAPQSNAPAGLSVPAFLFLCAPAAFADAAETSLSSTSMFAPASTPNVSFTLRVGIGAPGTIPRDEGSEERR